MLIFFFFFNDTATTEIYPLSLHDALPIYAVGVVHAARGRVGGVAFRRDALVPVVERRRTAECYAPNTDRKSTRLNSSHSQISYAVFCLKKKKKHLLRSTPRERHTLLYTVN